MIDTNIILIGPLDTGKSTVGKLLGEALAMPVVEIDDLRWAYYGEIGYDPDHAEQLVREGGILGRVAYWKPFEIYGVERLLQDHPKSTILPFGAGNSVYRDPAHIERLSKALAPYPYVVLLLPSLDIDESHRILMERFRKSTPDFTPDIFNAIAELNRHFLESSCNAQLAKYTFYTADRSPAETCQEVLKALDLQSP